MKTIAIIQARLGSTRFPRKVLADIGGKPMIAHVVERALAIRRVDRVVVAAPLADLAEIARAVSCEATVWPRTGPEDDVLRAYAECAEHYHAGIVMRLTGDCPLLCPYTASRVLREVRAGCADFARNDTGCCFPDGTDVEVFTAGLLRVAQELATDAHDREHVSPWMRRTMGLAAHVERGGADDLPWCLHAKFSVDTQEDLDRVRLVHAAGVKSFHVRDTIDAARRAGVLA